MKKITLLFALLLLGVTVHAQVTNEGEPVSWDLNTRSALNPVVLEGIDLETLQAEDAVNDKMSGRPWRFGYEYSVDLGLETAGVWDELPNGDGIWRINLVSEGAKTLNFVFDRYVLPPGAKVYLYSDDRTSLLGAYTDNLNNAEKMLGTWLVDGDNIWIEYYEPKAVRGQGELNLAKVVHGYRSKSQLFSDGVQAKGLNDSGSCNHDVDCPVGADWDPFKEDLKRSVALQIMGGFVCSGALINNTNNDKTPYFLTANHCDAGSPATWSFRFNWRSPAPSCGTTTPSTSSAFNTTSGAVNRAINSESDVRLVELNSAIPDSWNLVWAGWNRSTTAIPNYSVGIHHPSGDIMKVCRDNNSPSRAIYNFNGNPSTEMWRINGVGGGGGGGWEIGVTEGGSSGSPLFDQNGLIVGQLAGGTAACSGTSDNSGFDIYGRFDVSWDFGSSASNSVRFWLDPDGTAGDTLETLSTTDFQFESNLSIFPNPANSLVNVVHFGSSDLDYELYTILGQVVERGSFGAVNNELNVSGLQNGVYFLKIVDDENGASLTKKIVVRH
ncbi:T9SS type A sorting domain-containing protein [Gilvibacter sp.]|uniref:T9SS type A sorting domain-containing protein n=1 Tax=Gilvibacter sp. TaxID=2729997 RepID=UPI003F4A2F44